jgi:hypothetical protein
MRRDEVGVKQNQWPPDHSDGKTPHIPALDTAIAALNAQRAALGDSAVDPQCS